MAENTFRGTLGPDGYIVLEGAQLPDREVQVLVTVLDAAVQSPSAESETEWSFPVVRDAQWPDDIPVSREEMYGDDGR